MNIINIYKKKQGRVTFIGETGQQPHVFLSCIYPHEVDHRADICVVTSAHFKSEFTAEEAILSADHGAFGFRFAKQPKGKTQ
jgi:hypothetical protein